MEFHEKGEKTLQPSLYNTQTYDCTILPIHFRYGHGQVIWLDLYGHGQVIWIDLWTCYKMSINFLKSNTFHAPTKKSRKGYDILT